MTTNQCDRSRRGLRKAYGDHEVITGVDLIVPAGAVYALLEPNGAGARLQATRWSSSSRRPSARRLITAGGMAGARQAG